MNVGAQLPTGEVLSFPEGTTQDIVDRVVKKKLGLPVPPTSEEMAQQAEAALAAGRNDAIAALSGRLDALNESVARLCADGAETRAHLERVSQALASLDQTVAAAARAIFRGLTAAQTMVVERDEKSRIQSAKITKGAT